MTNQQLHEPFYICINNTKMLMMWNF